MLCDLAPTDIASSASKLDWDFIDSDTQYYTHDIHRYSGKFIPQIARQALELISSPEDLVLDPYVGSGTMALEALLASRSVIGIDLNPLAVLISEVKTMIIDTDVLSKFKLEMHAFIASLASNQSNLFLKHCDYSLDPKSDPRFADPWNRKWYQEDVLEQLIIIYSYIDNIQDESFKKIAQVAFSNILRKSSRASSKYPNVMFDKDAKRKPLPLGSYKQSFDKTIDALMQLSNANVNTKCSVNIIYGDNTNMSKLEDSSIDAIVTHPPYIAAIPYAEYCCLSLQWFGYDKREVDHSLTGGRRQSKDVVDRFRIDYSGMFSECRRVLKPNRYMFTMVGNPTVKGNIIDLEDMTLHIADESGLSHVVTVTRNGINRRGNNMGQEYLMFFQNKY